MSPIFAKLNLKSQREIVVLDAPLSFEAELASLAGVRVVRDLDALDSIHFALAFVTDQARLDSLVASLTVRAEGDALLWFAYPKATSKRYKCDFNRDAGWGVMSDAGFDSVRMVAIDEDWSALRFRRLDYIKRRS